MKAPTAIEILEWPEMIAFLEWAGFPPSECEEPVHGVVITLPKPDEAYPLLAYYGRQDPGMPRFLIERHQIPYDSMFVYGSNQFCELCKRMGVAHDLLTIDVTITVIEGEHPVVCQNYRISDTKE
jgi:hypothetical protein